MSRNRTFQTADCDGNSGGCHAWLKAVLLPKSHSCVKVKMPCNNIPFSKSESHLCESYLNYNVFTERIKDNSWKYLFTEQKSAWLILESDIQYLFLSHEDCVLSVASHVSVTGAECLWHHLQVSVLVTHFARMGGLQVKLPYLYALQQCLCHHRSWCGIQSHVLWPR